MKKILDTLEKIAQDADTAVNKAKDKKALEDLKTKFLGRKAKLNSLLKDLGKLEKEERAEAGKRANEIKQKLTEQISAKLAQLDKSAMENGLKNESIDVTIPGKLPARGKIHPISQMLMRTEEIFEKMGFEVVLPYEIDDDYHNFTSLNMPEGHPARDAWDTFWTEDEKILITHTSSMQNRILKSKNPPIRAIVPGKCFRNEATDARHEHTFYQVEGIYVDKGITITDMLGTLKTYFEAFFEQTIQVKFMPDYFPFVEPGGQMALTCVLCEGKGCKVCKKSGWLEILGCGMIHPYVLKEAGIDPETYTGFAWGFGLERLIMLKNNIEDIRLFHSGDLRFIRQF